jgi:hypothetical protein
MSNGKRSRTDTSGLPGPTPGRNKAGGYKCPSPGGYQREAKGAFMAWAKMHERKMDRWHPRIAAA